MNTASTDFLYDGLNPVQEGALPTTPSANLLTGLGLDEFFTRTDAAGLRAFLSDALGSTVALADAAGAVQTEYTYAPFGETTAAGIVSSNPYQFTGRENDATGLYYYRARYYHPGLQRFISEDPIGFVAGDPNFYAYVGNSPVMFTDPSGEIAPLVSAAVACGAGAVGGAAVVLSGRKASWGEVALGSAIGCGGGLAVLGGWAAGAAAIAAVTATEAVTTATTALSGAAAAAASRALAQAEPVGRALASDLFHRASTWMRDVAVRSGTHFSIQSGEGRAVLTQVPGELNGMPGRFEYIVNRAGQLTHQLFVRGAPINGVPSKP